MKKNKKKLFKFNKNSNGNLFYSSTGNCISADISGKDVSVSFPQKNYNCIRTPVKKP